MRNLVRIIAAFALAVMSIAGIGSVAVAAGTGSITGHVYIEGGTTGINGARVSAYYYDTGVLAAEGVADVTGLYAITGLDAGSYWLKASRPGYFLEYYNNTDDYYSRAQVSVIDGVETTGIGFSLTAGSTISGYVMQSDNSTPIAVARVIAYDNGTLGVAGEGYSGTDGSYSITVPASENNTYYKLKADAKGFAAKVYENVTYTDPSDLSSGTTVMVAPSGDTVVNNFTLDATGYIAGVVYGADGATPVTMARIAVYDGSKTMVAYGYSGPSGYADHNYFINLDNTTTWRVLASKSGYIDQWYDNFTVATGDIKDDANWSQAAIVTVGDLSHNINFYLKTVKAVTTNAATGVTTTSATLNGNLTSKGASDNVTVSFEYDTDSGEPYALTTSGSVMNTTGEFSAPVSGLSDNTTYYFRAKAVGDLDAVPFYGSELTFTTNALGAPAVTTTAATNLAATSATLNGNLSDLGTATTVNVSFEWGTDTSYAGTPTAPEAKGAPGAFSAPLSGLSPNTTYHFRAKAVGALTAWGDDMTFTTSTTPPSVTTSAATNLAMTSATLNGNLGSLGTASNVTVSFAWGTTLGGPYPYPITVVPAMTGTGAFSADLSALTPGTSYYYVAKAVGDGAPQFGTEKTFTTLAAPAVTTGAGTLVTTTSATLNGNLTSKGSAGSVIVSFEWGAATGSYTQTTDNQTLSATGAFSANLSGLTPGTTYYYKAKAVGDATVRGEEMSFTALTTPPTVTTDNATNVLAASARLNGTLTSLGTAGSVTVSFVWGTTAGGPYPSLTDNQTMTSSGAFSANLSGLGAVKTYFYKAKVVVNGGTPIYGTEKSFTTIDTTAPVITVVSSSDFTVSGATITWSTNEAATTQVRYGLTEEYGSVTPEVTSLVTSHSVNLTGLKAGKTYHYQVISKDAANNQAVSADATFKTAASSGGMPTWAWVLIGLAVVGVAGAAAYFIRGRLAQG